MLAVGLKAGPPPHFQGYSRYMTVSHMRAANGGAMPGGEQTTVANGSAVHSGGMTVDAGSALRGAGPQHDARIALARELYAARRRRSRLFPADLFGEPTWDILLDLYVAGRESRRVPTTSACIGAHVPPTTALRWLRILESRGFVERESDGKDGRRTFVRLTARGNAAMDDFLDAMLANIGDGALHADGVHAPGVGA